MSIDVEDSIKGFVQTIGRKEILPFLGIYQRLVYSYVFLKKLIKTYNPDFILVTGDLIVLPNSMAEKTIVYVHFPSDLALLQKDYTSKIMKRKIMRRLYIQTYLFISNNIDYINDFDYLKKATIIA